MCFKPFAFHWPCLHVLQPQNSVVLIFRSSVKFITSFRAGFNALFNFRSKQIKNYLDNRILRV
jgi:hypothetical protein